MSQGQKEVPPDWVWEHLAPPQRVAVGEAMGRIMREVLGHEWEGEPDPSGADRFRVRAPVYHEAGAGTPREPVQSVCSGAAGPDPGMGTPPGTGHRLGPGAVGAEQPGAAGLPGTS